MRYRPHDPPSFLLFGYDPARDLPKDHLARLVERVVEEALPKKGLPVQPGQPAFDPRLCVKVLVYGYATGVRSSRQLERRCRESLPSLFLTRGDTPSYPTLCSFRALHKDPLETVWVSLFALAEEGGRPRLGRIVLDSTKLRADAGPEAVVKADEYQAVKAELERILQEAQATDAGEEENPPGSTHLDKEVEPEQMRAILRRVRKQLAAPKHSPTPSAGESPPPSAPRESPALRSA